MNLIEQLGGYERAKRIEKNIYGTGGRLIRYPSKDFDYNDDSGSVCDVELISFKANDLKKISFRIPPPAQYFWGWG